MFQLSFLFKESLFNIHCWFINVMSVSTTLHLDVNAVDLGLYPYDV